MIAIVRQYANIPEHHDSCWIYLLYSIITIIIIIIIITGLENRDYGHRGSATLTTQQPAIHKSRY
jgi:hypothetical protein